MFIILGGQNQYVTGNTAPGSAAAEGGGTTWTNPTNILADDGSEAGYTDPQPDASSKEIYAYNFGFAIPAGATILRYIPVVRFRATTDVDKLASVFGSAGHYSGGTFTPISGGIVASKSVVGVNFTSETAITLDDNGTQAVTAADVNQATFCIGVSILTTSGIYSPDLLVDSVTLRLEYEV